MRLAIPPDGRLPFLNGVYVAIDALPGAVVVVDGPYCVSTKALRHMAHHLRSDLVPPFGRARVVPTLLESPTEEVTRVSLDRTREVGELLRAVCGWPEADVVFTTSFDFLQLVNFPMAGLGRAASQATGRLVCDVPSRSLGGTWLDGYAGVCEALAREIPLAPRPRPGSVALVGHLMDRAEGDQVANVAELRRLVEALGFRVDSLWLSGEPLASLARVEECGAIVSLPYARNAARILGERLSVPVVEAGLPLGLGGTGAFLDAVAGPLGAADRARQVHRQEAAAAVRDVEVVVGRCLAGLDVVTRFDDPCLREAVAGFCDDLGMACTDAADLESPEAVRPARAVVLSSTEHWPALPYPAVPFGYPIYVEHPVTPRPFLGYAGFRVLVERLATAILRAEAGAGG